MRNRDKAENNGDWSSCVKELKKGLLKRFRHIKLMNGRTFAILIYRTVKEGGRLKRK